MEKLFELWDEFEVWHAENQKDPIKELMYMRSDTPTFAQFRAWYRDVYPLKSPL